MPEHGNVIGYFQACYCVGGGLGSGGGGTASGESCGGGVDIVGDGWCWWGVGGGSGKQQAIITRY